MRGRWTCGTGSLSTFRHGQACAEAPSARPRTAARPSRSSPVNKGYISVVFGSRHRKIEEKKLN